MNQQNGQKRTAVPDDPTRTPIGRVAFFIGAIFVIGLIAFVLFCTLVPIGIVILLILYPSS